MKRLLVFIVLTLGLVSCRTPSSEHEKITSRPRFYLEAGEGSAIPVILPQSGVRVMVNPQPVFTEGDIANAEVTQVDLGKCLMLQFTPAAARDLYRLSVAAQGRRLVMTVNDAPLGARRLDGPIGTGVLYIFVEVPDAQLPTLVENIKKSSAILQRELARP